MPRLTETAKFPVQSGTFKRCMLCGVEKTDICEFQMLHECDEDDIPEPGRYLIICKSKACWQIIEEHPRMYRDTPWSRTAAGAFMLTCGNCPHRKDFDCTHSKLTKNGGEGLEAKISPMFGGAIGHLYYADEGCVSVQDMSPVTYCEGNPNGR